MSAPDKLFHLQLPIDEPPAASDVVVPFPGAAAEPVPADSAPSGVVEVAEQPAALVERFQPAVDRLTSAWRSAWVGDGVLGMRPRPVADLARQYWTDPKPYIRDALILRIPYAAYGVPVVVLTAAAHLLLLIISYPTLLAGTGLLVVILSLFT